MKASPQPQEGEGVARSPCLAPVRLLGLVPMVVGAMEKAMRIACLGGGAARLRLAISRKAEAEAALKP